MPDAYQQLLDATITHLEELRATGRRFVTIAPEVLAALGSPPVKTPVAATPALSGAKVGPALAQVSAPRPGYIPPPPPPRAIAPRPAAPAVSTEPPFTSPVLAPAEKEAAIAELRTRVLACVKCAPLVATRQSVVFGVGDVQASLMFVGEAPGADEDRLGEPFVGRAGQLLTKIIETMGLSRNTVYIGNILKCRPDTQQGESGNRTPRPDEMATCKPYIISQIEIIRPKVIIALGATAVQGLLGNATGITRLRGNWLDYRGIAVMPTFHPSYLLRPENEDKKRPVWEDMLKVMDKLAMPISDKQRRFFLKRA